MKNTKLLLSVIILFVLSCTKQNKTNPPSNNTSTPHHQDTATVFFKVAGNALGFDTTYPGCTLPSGTCSTCTSSSSFQVVDSLADSVLSKGDSAIAYVYNNGWKRLPNNNFGVDQEYIGSMPMDTLVQLYAWNYYPHDLRPYIWFKYQTKYFSSKNHPTDTIYFKIFIKSN
jgi:hypothetical protein